LGANMDNDLVSVSEQRFSRSMSKPVSGAGDEDTSLLVGVRRRRRRSLFLSRVQRSLRDGRCGATREPATTPLSTLPRSAVKHPQCRRPWDARCSRHRLPRRGACLSTAACDSFPIASQTYSDPHRYQSAELLKGHFCASVRPRSVIEICSLLLFLLQEIFDGPWRSRAFRANFGLVCRVDHT
jgi:hypothetical protein